MPFFYFSHLVINYHNLGTPSTRVQYSEVDITRSQVTVTASEPLVQQRMVRLHIDIAQDGYGSADAEGVKGLNLSTYFGHWIGLRENLQETMFFTIKYRVFL